MMAPSLSLTHSLQLREIWLVSIKKKNAYIGQLCQSPSKYSPLESRTLTRVLFLLFKNSRVLFQYCYHLSVSHILLDLAHSLKSPFQ